MVLVIHQRKREPIPGEDGHWFELQPLTGAQRDRADQSKTRSVLGLFEGVDERLLDKLTKSDSDGKGEEKTSRIGSYDLELVIEYGLVNWSYGEPCDKEHKLLLDARTRDWAAERILEMSERPAPEASASVGA